MACGIAATIVAVPVGLGLMSAGYFVADLAGFVPPSMGGGFSGRAISQMSNNAFGGVSRGAVDGVVDALVNKANDTFQMAKNNFNASDIALNVNRQAQDVITNLDLGNLIGANGLQQWNNFLSSSGIDPARASKKLSELIQK